VGQITHWDTNAESRWCLLKSPEGEFTRYMAYRSLDALVEALNNLEGTEVSVQLAYGVPMYLTKTDVHGCRYLILPGGADAIRVDDPDMEVIDADLLDHLEPQEDGWLGDPELAESALEGYFSRDVKKEEAPVQADDESDDDDDDEGEFKEEPAG